MKLIIEIDVDSSDLEEADVDVFLEELGRPGATVNIEVGSPLGEDSPVARYFNLSTEYVTAIKRLDESDGQTT